MKNCDLLSWTNFYFVKASGAGRDHAREDDASFRAHGEVPGALSSVQLLYVSEDQLDLRDMAETLGLSLSSRLI